MASSLGLSWTILSADSRTAAVGLVRSMSPLTEDAWPSASSPGLIGATSALPSGICRLTSAIGVSTSVGVRGGAPHTDGRAEAVGDVRSAVGVVPPAAWADGAAAGLLAGPDMAFTDTPQDLSSFSMSASSVAAGGLVCLFCAVIAKRWTTGTLTLVLPCEQQRQGPHASLFSAVHIRTEASRRSISTSSCGLLILLYSIRSQHGVNKRVLF
mmetsp:Transcript_34701/g.79529  ORF Transcript_34701/g.79529 Transcript_34701/m.79529 type:complete len:212 (+) Transcript_34701:1272-1907(+)